MCAPLISNESTKRAHMLAGPAGNMCGIGITKMASEFRGQLNNFQSFPGFVHNTYHQSSSDLIL